MKWLIILAAISVLVGAKPEKYKEQEDFQYSRSSSDEGTKSGYYDAQRGNMGGNYERAHNMDSLAQHQMSGLVRQVEGELGEGANTRTGSVYSAASSKGIYGSGRFDTSNLHGRNFQEGVSYDMIDYHDSNVGSSSHTAHSLSAHNSADYANRYSQIYGGYGRTTSDTQAKAEDLVSRDNLQTSKQHKYGSTRHSSGYQSQAGFQEQEHYDSDNTNSHTGYGSNIYTRYTPVRIVVTPGGRVALPVTVQTYDATHGSSILNHNALDSEVATSDMNQGSVYRPGNTKYYQASYKYNKKWEKHDTVPTSVSGVIPTEGPIPKHSELYEDVDVQSSGSQNSARETDFRSRHSSSASGRYNAAKSTSSHYGYNSNYYSPQYSGVSSDSNAYTHTGYRAQLGHGSSSDFLNTQAQRNSESRYSGISTDSVLNTQGRYNAGSQRDFNSQVEDLTTRPKSYHSSYSYHKSWERQGDPYVIEPVSATNSNSHTSQRLSSSSTKNLGFATYQPSSQYSQRNCEENCHMRVTRSQGTDNQHMEQQASQNLYDDQDLGQQVQGTWKNLEDLGQLSQKDWGQQADGQQFLNQWDNLKDLNQQSQGNWDQQNVEQQSQNNWEQQSVGQQSQNDWGQQNVGQQSQSHWENLDDLGQQTQSKWDQQNVEQQKKHNQDNNLENLNQQLTAGQQTDSQTSAFENLGQISQNNWDQQNIGQQTNINWDKIETLDQQSNSNWDQQNVQQPNESWDKLEKLNQQSLTKPEEVGQDLPNQHTFNKFEDIREVNQKNVNSDIFGQHARNVLEQHNQDLEYELSYKPQHDLYAQFAHKSEVIPKDTNLQHSEFEKEKVLGKKVDNIWDKFDNMDVDNVKVNFDHIQNNTSNTENQTHENDADFLGQNESHSYKDIINDNIDVVHHQKESNDNSDYSYSNGFVNPFFNQYHKNQLSHYDSTYSENNGAFETNNWNSNLHSYSNSDFDLQKVDKSHTNNQDTSLTSLWSKFEKMGSGMSTEMNRTSTFFVTNETKSNLTSIDTNGNGTIENQPWYVRDPHETESSTVSESPEYNGSLSYNIDLKELQPLNDDKPETPQDIGRGDIEPEKIIDIDESEKPYKNPSSILSQNTFNSSVEYDNVKEKNAQNINMYRENDVLDDKLAVLSIQHQKNENINVHSNKSELTNNMLQTISQQNKNVNKNEYSTDLKNVKVNETGNINLFNQSHMLTYTNNLATQTDTKTDNILNHENGTNHEVELQNRSNFEQETVNVEQENLYNFGQEDLQIFAQQNENVENQNLHNFQDPLQELIQHNENSEHQNLYNFGQEQVLEAAQKNIEQNSHNFGQEQLQDATRKNIEKQNLHNFGQEQVLEVTQKNIEQQNLYNFGQHMKILNNATQKTFGSEKKQIFDKQQRNQSQQDFYMHNNTEMQIENREQQNLSKETIGFNNAQTKYAQLVNHHYEQITPTNLPRVQKSVGSIEEESSLNKNQEDLLYVQQNIQDLGGQREHMPHEQIVEHNYAVDYEPNIASFEQEFEQDLGQQHQTSNGYFNKFEQQSQNLADIQQSTQQSIIHSNPTTTTSTQRTIVSVQKTEKVTENPSFWRSVGNKISSAKDKVVSWFRS